MGSRQSRTGDAVHRDVVDESQTCSSRHCRKALVVGGRGCEADEVDALPQSPGCKARHPFPAADRRRSGRRCLMPSASSRKLLDAVDIDRDCSNPSSRSASALSLFAEIGVRVRSVFASVCPPFSARWPAIWIAGPSAIGSENGMPSSMTSDPASGKRLHDAERGLEVRVAAHEIGDERRAAFSLQDRQSVCPCVRSCSYSPIPSNLADGEDVLVAAAGEVHQDRSRPCPSSARA